MGTLGRRRRWWGRAPGRRLGWKASFGNVGENASGTWSGLSALLLVDGQRGSGLEAASAWRDILLILTRNVAGGAIQSIWPAKGYGVHLEVDKQCRDFLCYSSTVALETGRECT